MHANIISDRKPPTKCEGVIGDAIIEADQQGGLRKNTN